MLNADCGVRNVRAMAGGLAACAALFAVTGCAKPQLVMTQGQYINTAMHANRPEGSRTGQPLELAIVYVYPDDLKHVANGRLAPESGITSDVWFRDRPKRGDVKDMANRESRFWLPEEQILVVTNDSQVYGKPIRAEARGAAHDNTEVVVQRELGFKGPMKNNRSVIYVFARFTDAQGKVLPEPPAKFHPPGDFGKELRVRIGERRLEAGGRT